MPWLPDFRKFKPLLILTGVVGGVVGGAVAAREVHSYIQQQRFYREYQRAGAYYPNILLVYHPDADVVRIIREHFLEAGGRDEKRAGKDVYGIVVARDISDARRILDDAKKPDGVRISAIISGHGRRDEQGIKDYELRTADGSTIPRRTVRSLEDLVGRDSPGEAKARLDRLEGNLQQSIRRRNEPAYQLLREIGGYFDTRRAQSFRTPPENIEDALRELMSRGNGILRYLGEDSHNGGGFFTSHTGEPIIDDEYYEHSGLFFKIDTLANTNSHVQDYAGFNSPASGQVARFARPLTAVPYKKEGKGMEAGHPESLEIFVTEYFMGPSFAAAYEKMIGRLRELEAGTGSLRAEMERYDAEIMLIRTIIMNMQSARFSVAAKYHQAHRADSPDASGVDAILQDYAVKAPIAYGVLKPLLKGTGHDEAAFGRFIGCLGRPELRNATYYGLIMDLSLQNAKLMMGINNPGLDEIISFLTTQGRVLTPEEIEPLIGVYDTGYKKKHYVDTLTRGAYSSYVEGLENPDAIRYAVKFAEKELYARIAANQGIIANAISALNYFGRFRQERANISIWELAVNFHVITAYRLMRMAEDSVKGALRNELLFAAGKLKPDEHAYYRKLYEGNVRVNSHSWYLSAMSGALFFEANRPESNTFRSLKRMWSETGNALERAKKLDVQAPAEDVMSWFSFDLAKDLAGYAMLARDIEANPSRLSILLEDTRERCPIKVDFGLPGQAYAA
ncbi:hypothetical protein HYY72_00230 [Candidatus Woesearchaeota archaeon]|nr:hypothetical protein [Candidatus Woesearchaeota archaeon]